MAVGERDIPFLRKFYGTAARHSCAFAGDGLTCSTIRYKKGAKRWMCSFCFIHLWGGWKGNSRG